MPKRPLRPCSAPMCKELVSERFCEKHKKQERKRSDEQRGSYRERGYTTQYDKFRAWWVNQQPLCQPCSKEGRVVPMEILHHIKPIAEGGDLLSADNALSVCRKCHAKIHAKG